MLVQHQRAMQLLQCTEVDAHLMGPEMYHLLLSCNDAGCNYSTPGHASLCIAALAERCLNIAGQRGSSDAGTLAAVPSQSAVLDWAAALLDAQLTSIASRVELAPLLRSLQVWSRCCFFSLFMIVSLLEAFLVTSRASGSLCCAGARIVKHFWLTCVCLCK